MVKLVRYIYFPHQNALQTKTPAQLRNADGLRDEKNKGIKVFLVFRSDKYIL
jgi:hypothetical protein